MIVGKERARTCTQGHANAERGMKGGHDRLLVFSFHEYSLAIHRNIHGAGKETGEEKAGPAHPDILTIGYEGYDTAKEKPGIHHQFSAIVPGRQPARERHRYQGSHGCGKE